MSLRVSLPHSLARGVSIVGHPLLLLPAALLATQAPRLSRLQLVLLALGLATFALLVVAYTRLQVRRGRWRHVDASGTSERRRLNLVLLRSLLAGAVLAWAAGSGAEVVLTLLLASAMIVAALLSARTCLLSLHVAFAVFAALLALRSAWWAGALLLAVAALVAWSRLALRRHAPRDLVAGASAGALAGTVFLLLTASWQA